MSSGIRPPRFGAGKGQIPSTVSELVKLVQKGEIKAQEILEVSLQTIAESDGEINSFNLVLHEQALEDAKKVDASIAKGGFSGRLAGIPIAIKDNICTRGISTTCSSKILANWKPPYDASVITKLKSEGAIIVGKTNMDEFAMGSSTETSFFGPTKNPWDKERVPGGSSGGSAAAVAAGMVPLAIGSDTGGSIRQPASLCGVVGIKPTYGLVSRYGLVAFASSLDQIGPFASCVDDAALLLDVLAFHDEKDSTSLGRDRYQSGNVNIDVSSLKVGIISNFLPNAAESCHQAVTDAARVLANFGAKVDEVDIKELDYAIAAYYIIAPAEASSNLARFDGVRYGLRVDGADVEEMNIKTRTEGFGVEVKRRIMLGTYALSAGYYDAYYLQAQKIRTLVKDAFNKAYGKYDLLLSPTSPTVAFPLGSKVADPLSMYLSDLYTIPTNLAGHPAISVPYGIGEDDMPVGLQLLGPALSEPLLIKVAKMLEENNTDKQDN